MIHQQFRYFREFMKRQRPLQVLQKRQRHLQPSVQRHRYPPLEGLINDVRL